MLRAHSLHSFESTTGAAHDPSAAARRAAAADGGQVEGGVRLTLRAEGLFVLIAAAIIYAKSGFGWGPFALFFLAPDLSFLGYLAGNRIGAVAYNAAHSYVGALACFGAALIGNEPALEAAAMIWCAHIGFDRAMGYGLKYAAGFGVTHLGLIGRAARGGGPPASETIA